MSLRAPAVWLVSLLSSSVAAASMVVNDYFDFRSGADAVNSPQKVCSKHHISCSAADLTHVYVVIPPTQNKYLALPHIQHTLFRSHCRGVLLLLTALCFLASCCTLGCCWPRASW